MRARTKTVLDSDWVTLVKYTNPKTKRVHYAVKVEVRNVFSSAVLRAALQDDIRNHFDPNGCRGGQYSMSWKFRNKHEAEQLILTAILKWGA